MTIAEIKGKVLQIDIVDVIGGFVKLKREGAEYVACCPFHNERSPSFSVNNKKGIFKCFGCGASGDSIAFVQRHEKLGFVDALKFIAADKHLNINFDIRDNKTAIVKQPEKQIKAVDAALMVRSMQYYQNNALARFLATRSTEKRVLECFFKYNVGTSKDGGTIFWQIDQFMRVRTAQKIVYGLDGHRMKWQVDKNGKQVKVYPKRLFTREDGYDPCLFGEHLLFEAKKDMLICIVESEKTAVICDMYLPTIEGIDCIWIASCGANGLTDEKIWVLRGLNVCLCPDFSFTSRAVWGAVPMRKKYIDGKLTMAEDGELEEDYVSAAIKLAKLGCKVSFYDCYPEIKNGSDIADELLKERAPKMLAKPDFSRYILPLEGFS